MRIGEANRYSYTAVRQAEQPAAHQKQTGQTELLPSTAVFTAPTPSQDNAVIFVKERQTLNEESLQKQQQDAKLEIEELKRQLENSNEQADAIRESLMVRIKCLIISMRIMSGDEVPREDYRYLAKNDPELYGKALTMRIARENPKKHKRVSEDESNNDLTNSAVDASENGLGKLPGTGETSELPIADASSEQNIPAAQLDVKA